MRAARKAQGTRKGTKKTPPPSAKNKPGLLILSYPCKRLKAYDFSAHNFKDSRRTNFASSKESVDKQKGTRILLILLNRVVSDFWKFRDRTIFPVSVWGCAFFPRLCPRLPTFASLRHPRESGDPEAGEREKQEGKPGGNAQSTGTPRIWVPLSRGMTKKRACLGLNAQNSSE
jgi:hypothetical protein